MSFALAQRLVVMPSRSSSPPPTGVSSLLCAPGVISTLRRQILWITDSNVIGLTNTYRPLDAFKIFSAPVVNFYRRETPHSEDRALASKSAAAFAASNVSAVPLAIRSSRLLPTFAPIARIRPRLHRRGPLYCETVDAL